MDDQSNSEFKSDLFRPEAVEYARVKHYGTILLIRPLSHTALTLLFAGVTVGLILFFTLFSYTRKAELSGVVLPVDGLIRIFSAQGGVVTERHVHEGQVVSAGDLLFTLCNERYHDTQGGVENEIISLLKSRRDSFGREGDQLHKRSHQRLKELEQRIGGLEAEAQRIDEQISFQHRRLGLAEESLKQYTHLHKSRAVSKAAVQERQSEMLDQKSRWVDLKRAKGNIERDLSAARVDIEELTLKTQRDQSDLERNIAALHQEITENEVRLKSLIRAPQAGTISAITAEIGQTISANKALATVVPLNSKLEAELYAPSWAVGFIKKGSPVLLRCRAYPYQKFGQMQGQVRELSSTSMQPDELALPGAIGFSPSERFYRVRVRLEKQDVIAYGTEHPLKIGMVMDASVLLERRKIYEWMFSPLYSMVGRI